MAHKTNAETNLRPPTTEEARIRGSKGGKARAANARALKSFSAAAGDRLTPEKQKKMLDRLELLVLRGNLRAWDLYLKLLNQHPDQTTAGDTSVTIRIEGAEDYGN